VERTVFLSRHWMVVFSQIYIPIDLPRQWLGWIMVGAVPIYMWQCTEIFLSLLQITLWPLQFHQEPIVVQNPPTM